MPNSPDSSRAPDHRIAIAAAAGRANAIGMYLTNGVFLYRFVDLVVTEAGDMADIEDCYRLDIVRVPVRELLARRLRVVRPA